MSPRDELLAILARVSGRPAGELSEDMDLFVDLEIDSVRAVELLAEMEVILGVEISDAEVARLETVGDVLNVAEVKADGDDGSAVGEGAERPPGSERA